VTAMKRDNFTLVCGVFLVLGVIVGVWMGHSLGIRTGKLLGIMDAEKSWRLDCVQNGAAEFYLDEKFERRWRWKRDAPLEAVSNGRKRVPK